MFRRYGILQSQQLRTARIPLLRRESATVKVVWSLVHIHDISFRADNVIIKLPTHSVILSCHSFLLSSCMTCKCQQSARSSCMPFCRLATCTVFPKIGTVSPLLTICQRSDSISCEDSPDRRTKQKSRLYMYVHHRLSSLAALHIRITPSSHHDSTNTPDQGISSHSNSGSA